jgi:hypothetical protein
VAWVKWGDDIKRIAAETFAAVKNWLVDQWQGSIFQKFAQMLQAMNELFDALRMKMIEKAQQIFQGVKEWLSDKLAPVFTAIRNFFDPVVQLWTAAKDKVIAIVTAMYNGVKTWLVDKFTAIVDSLKAKIEAATEFFRVMKDKVVGNSYVREMVEGIDKQIARLDSVMVQPIQRATTTSQQMFSGMSTGVQGIVGNLFDSIQGKTTNWSQSFQSIIHGVSGSTQNIFGALSSSLQQIVGGMFNSLLGQATNWGQMFMGILTNIIGAGINSLVSWGLSQLGRLIGGWVGGGEEGTQVNPARNQFLSQFGPAGTGEGSGFWNLGLALEGAVGFSQAQALHQAMQAADTMAEFNAAIAAINAALGGGGGGAPSFPGGGGGGTSAPSPGDFNMEAPEDVMGEMERMARGMAHGGFGRVDRPTLFFSRGDEDFAFSGEGKSFGGAGKLVFLVAPRDADADHLLNMVEAELPDAIRSNRHSLHTRLRAALEIG